jgi:hypothetical protein
MTYETLPASLAPHQIGDESSGIMTQRTVFQTGDVQEWPRFHRGRRSWPWSWKVSTESEAEQLKAYIKAHRGAETPFYWTRPTREPLPRPYIAPTLEKKTGGSVGSRGALYVAHTWSDETSETAPSFMVGAIALATDEIITATTLAFPTNVTEAIIYVGTSATYANLKKQTPVITDPTIGWHEPATGYDTGGAAPPTSNAFTETVLVYCIEDSLQTQKNQHNVWSLSVHVQERGAA